MEREWTFEETSEGWDRLVIRDDCMESHPRQLLPTPEELRTVRVQWRLAIDRMHAYKDVVRDIALLLQEKNVSESELRHRIGAAVQRV